MDNENTVLTEQNESAETSAELDAAFDTGWEGDGPEQAAESPEESVEESEGTEADADQQTDEGTEGGEDDSPEGESEGAPDQAGDSYTIKVLGEERTVTGRDNIIELLQKGSDYDRVKGKWDGVKDDVPKLRMYEVFLKELADARGSDIDSLIDETRVRAMLAQAEARGEKLDPAAAAAQAVRTRLQGMQPGDRQQTEPDAGGAPEHQQDDMIGAFLKVYGNTVAATDIPKEVWEEAQGTGDLLGPYQRYVNRNLEADNKKLREELEAVKKQQKNKERSTGSTKTVGAGAAMDPFDEGWEL